MSRPISVLFGHRVTAELCCPHLLLASCTRWEIGTGMLKVLGSFTLFSRSLPLSLSDTLSLSVPNSGACCSSLPAPSFNAPLAISYPPPPVRSVDVPLRTAHHTGTQLKSIVDMDPLKVRLAQCPPQQSTATVGNGMVALKPLGKCSAP